MISPSRFDQGNRLTPLLDLPLIKDRADGIDFLRAILPLWVLISHLLPWAATVTGQAMLALPVRWLNSIFQSNGETHPAVICFIVLSGYCIHRGGFRRNRLSLADFAVRRLFRILPVFALATLAGAVCFAFDRVGHAELAQRLTGTESISAKSLLLKLAGVSAWWPALHRQSFQGNAPLATVAAEIWLYALYAVCALAALPRVSGRRFWLGLGSIWLLGLLVTAGFPALQGWWHNGSLIGFALYWWIGAASVDAAFSSRLARHGRMLIAVWLALTCLFVVESFTFHHTSFLLAELRKVVFGLGCGWLIATVDRRDLGIFTAFAPLGRAGYSLYAFHAPLLIAMLLLGVPWWLAAAIVLPVGLALYRYFELPWQRYGRSLAKSLATRDETYVIPPKPSLLPTANEIG